MQKLLVIVGPTASGKSALAIELARQFNGEVISADSRQIYKGFPVTTCVVTSEEMQGVSHHLLEAVPIDQRLSVVDFQAKAKEKIAEIASRGKLPILCGGTGHWIDSVLYGEVFPEAIVDEELQARLNVKTAEELFAELKERDPERAATIEPKNKRRLVRALEIIETQGKVPKSKPRILQYDTLIIGLRPDKETLRPKIESRVQNRLDAMIAEIEAAYRTGRLPRSRATELGFDFSLTLDYLDGKVSREELAQRLSEKDWQYARRQMTWFKRNPDIHWISPEHLNSVPTTVADWITK